MKVAMPVARARNRQRETDQVIALKSPNRLSADLLRNRENAQRNQISFAEIPYLLLQCHTGPHFIERRAFANDYRISSHARPYPCCLACCHSNSSSSMLACSGFFPVRLSRSSIHPNRCRNLRLVLRSADSGSRDSQRAIFTSTNSMSPTSSSSASLAVSSMLVRPDPATPCLRGLGSGAGTFASSCWSSPVSSRSFSSRPSKFAQSNPTLEAFALSLCASSSAGMAFEMPASRDRGWSASGCFFLRSSAFSASQLRSTSEEVSAFTSPKPCG